MKKLLLWCIPVLILVFFILAMNSDFIFKRPMGGYSVEEHLELMGEDINKSDWDAAETEVETMEKYLDKKVFPYIQLSDERENINNMKRNLQVIKAGIHSKDQGLALVSYQNIKCDWDDLGK